MRSCYCLPPEPAAAAWASVRRRLLTEITQSLRRRRLPPAQAPSAMTLGLTLEWAETPAGRASIPAISTRQQYVSPTRAET